MTRLEDPTSANVLASPGGLGLHHLLRELAPPPIRRALEITDRLEELDPSLMKWLNASDAPRWENAPKVSDDDHVEIRALFDELMEIVHTYVTYARSKPRPGCSTSSRSTGRISRRP